MMNWLKGWKGIAAGAVLIVLSLIYNSVFKAYIDRSVLIQIPGYFLIGIGTALVLYAALASPESPKQDSSDNLESSPEGTDDVPSEEE